MGGERSGLYDRRIFLRAEGCETRSAPREDGGPQPDLVRWTIDRGVAVFGLSARRTHCSVQWFLSPHPGLLLWGEGDSLAASAANRNAELRFGKEFCLRRAAIVPNRSSALNSQVHGPNAH